MLFNSSVYVSWHPVRLADKNLWRKCNYPINIKKSHYPYSLIRCWLQLLTPMSGLVTIRSMGTLHQSVEVCATKKSCHLQFFFVLGRRCRVSLPALQPPIFISVARGKGAQKRKISPLFFPFSSFFFWNLLSPHTWKPQVRSSPE